MIVVIGVLSFALPALFAIFFTILHQQSRILRLSEVKNQGLYVSNILTYLVRDYATGIYSSTPPTGPVCNYGGTTSYSTPPLYFLDRGGHWFNFDVSSNKIASTSSIAASSADLTSSTVYVSSFTQECSLVGHSTPIVTFSYQICYNINNSCGTGADVTSLNFQTTVKLLNY